MCTVVNLRNSAYDVYIGRAGHGKEGTFGNPFIVGRDGERGECVKLFEKWFASDDPAAQKMRHEVRNRIRPGMKLGCFCKPRACHGDVIARYVNNNFSL